MYGARRHFIYNVELFISQFPFATESLIFLSILRGPSYSPVQLTGPYLCLGHLSDNLGLDVMPLMNLLTYILNFNQIINLNYCNIIYFIF